MNDKTAIDYSNIYEQHPGEWVALADDEETVLATDKSAQKVIEKAKKIGSDNPILFKVPKESRAYVGVE